MISEIDLKDFNRSETPVKLCDVPRNSIVQPLFNLDLVLDFQHVDGMYSLCTLFGTIDVVHLGASTEVYVWKKK